jgi:hypothetical protein
MDAMTRENTDPELIKEVQMPKPEKKKLPLITVNNFEDGTVLTCINRSHVRGLLQEIQITAMTAKETASVEAVKQAIAELDATMENPEA